jgi:NADP-dependent aldehyde dehydrogenase
MSELAGLSLIGFDRGAAAARTFRGVNPATGEALEPPYHPAAPADVERACRLADEASLPYGRSAPAARAGLLRGIAEGLEGEGGAIVARAQAETGLPQARLQSELARTCHQLRLFAGVAEDASWVDARIDSADPERKPLPRPDVRSLRVPLGPVVVFGASNFPLAFSVAGGDAASALAAGNPILVKGHAAHPGTSEAVGRIVQAAVRSRGLPEGTFALLFDDGFGVGQELVQHPLMRAVGFTGSRSGGLALLRLAQARTVPIPVYAEMGSVNPVWVLPGALRERAAAIAEGLHASFTLGVGQFCTNPGVVILEAGPAGEALMQPLAERTRATACGVLLNAGIHAGYDRGLERLRRLGGRLLAQGAPPQGDRQQGVMGSATLWQADAAQVLAEPGLLDEVFGPSTLVVCYRTPEELERLWLALPGQLTASIHALPEELAAHAPLLERIARRAGRLLFNQFPTGVEVNHAMVHGGPFPATSDGRSTSVGTRAIERFSRLLAFQSFPQQALPPELQDANPRGLWRLVDGAYTRGALPVKP